MNGDCLMWSGRLQKTRRFNSRVGLTSIIESCAYPITVLIEEKALNEGLITYDNIC